MWFLFFFTYTSNDTTNGGNGVVAVDDFKTRLAMFNKPKPFATAAATSTRYTTTPLYPYTTLLIPQYHSSPSLASTRPLTFSRPLYRLSWHPLDVTPAPPSAGRRLPFPSGAAAAVVAAPTTPPPNPLPLPTPTAVSYGSAGAGSASGGGGNGSVTTSNVTQRYLPNTSSSSSSTGAGASGVGLEDKPRGSVRSLISNWGK